MGRVLMLLFVFVLIGCDDKDFANYSFPPGATDKKILGNRWYSFKLDGQCFLGYGMAWAKYRTLTGVDCKD